MTRTRRKPPSGLWLLGAALAAGCSGSGPAPEPSGAFTATAASGDGSYSTPLDTTPSSDGSVFYFTAYSTEAGAESMGVFKVAASGGPVTKIFSGAPLQSPLGIAISSDDKTLYIADSAAGHDPNDPDARPGVGQIFKLPVAGGTPMVVSGTEGTRPRGLDLRAEGNNDVLYFSGNDPQSGAPALLRIGTGGLTTVASGEPFHDPSGVAVADNGDVYVTDSTGSGGSSRASVIKVAGGAASVLVSGLQVGSPAGAALTRSQTLLLVSGRNGDRNADLVYKIRVATGEVSSADAGIADNTDAGGLHRARNADLFSWADLTAGGRGTIYRIEFK